MKEKIDPITSEVILSSFQTISDEMSTALVRSAYSTNIKERKDCSCAIFDKKGNLIVLAENIPIHLGSMQGLMTQIGENLNEWEFESGDILIANDPYLGGGSHLPDMTLVKPIFKDGDLIGFTANIAHWTDVGGRFPGVGTAGDSTEIFQEGVRIPPSRLVQGGDFQQDMLDILLSNMRNREEREGDLRAQIASLKLGERRLKEVYEVHGKSKVTKVIEDIYGYSQNWLEKSLSEIPEGTYSFEDVMDDDGVDKEKLKIRISIKISHQPSPSIEFDFSGTDDQASGGINMVWQALQATVYYSVKAIIAPKIHINHGFMRNIRIKAPKGSLVNAEEPAAVGGRTDTAQRVVDVIMGAFSKVLPEKVIAASNGATTAIIFGGTKALSGKDFVYVEALGGGMGSRKEKDGQDGVQVNITNTSNLPIEAMEMEYPLRVLSYGLVPDSGGAGRFRGGLGIQKSIQALVPLTFSAHSDRHKVSPWGLFNGKPGGKGSFILHKQSGEKQTLRSKASGISIEKDDVLSFKTAGGGGYGSPLRRNVDLVKEDCINGKVTREKARSEYGVVITKQGKVDIQATKELRKKKTKKKKEKEK
ncbi:MAG: hydantoinase B/oxoprolinase family protein [Candidatus Aminicenantes bacterium]